MSDDLNTELRFGADTTGAEAGVNRVKRSLKDLGDSASKASKDAGDGLSKVGAGGDKAAKDVDRATKTMQNSLQRVIASFEGGEKGSRQFYESLARQRNVDVNTLKPLLDQLDAVKTKSQAAAQASVQVGNSFTGLGVAAGLAARAVAAIGIGASVGEFIRMADASTNVASRLSLVTSSTVELSSVQQRLFQVAQSSRVSFVDLVGTYAQVARSTKDLGVSQTALLGVIQTISQAVTISGGSAASAQAALTQLSQGFASGALRGEELNSILEQTPRLAQALADGLGVGVGKLRELGQAGALTSEAVLGALEKSAASVAAEFGKMAVTVESASTTAANSALKLVGALDSITGASAATAGGITRLSAGMDGLTLNIERLASSKGLSDFFFLAFNNERSLNGELEITQKELAGLEARLAKAPNNIYTRSAVAEMREYVKELKEAQARLAALSGQPSTPGAYDNRPEDRRLAEGSREAARLAKLREDGNAFRLNQAGVPASYLKDMAELIRLNQAGVIVGKEYTDALKKQQDILLQKTGTTKGAATAAKAEQNAYESLISSIRAKIEADKLELAGGAALTESQRIRIKLDQDLAAGRIKLGSLRETEVRLAIEELAVSEAAVTAAKTLAKANTDASASRDKYLTSLSTGIDKIKADIAAQQEATARMGLTKDAIAALDGAKLEMLATDLELQAIKALDRNLDQQTYDSLKEQAKLYRDLAAAKKDGAAKEIVLDLEKANEEAAKDAAREWQRAADDINRSLTDALLRGFESGKGFAENLRDTIKNMFSTLVLRPIVSAVVSPVAGAITGALGLGGATGAAQGLLGGVSGLASGANVLTGLQGTTGFLGNIGTFLGTNTVATNTAIATSLGIDAASASAAATGAASAGGGGLAGLFSNPITMGLGAVALLGILGKATKGETRTGGQFGVAFDGEVVNNRRGQTYTMVGQQFDRDFTNGQNVALTNGQAYRLEGDPVAQESAIRDAVAGTAKGIDAFLEALGSTARLTGFSAGLETSGKGRGGVFAGGTLNDGTTFGESGKGDNYAGTLFEKFSTNSPDFKTALENFTLDLKQSTIQALQSVSDIPEIVKKDLKDVNAEGLSEEAANKLLESINAQIVGVNQLKSAFDAMGMDELAKLSFDAAAGLAEVSGGFDKLMGNLNTYYSNFFSPEEQRANVQRQLQEQFKGLGLTLPDINASDARDQFRALVTAAEQDMSEEGRKTYATLLSLSGAFAGITTAAEGATAALKDQQTAISSLFQQALGRDRNSLNDQASALQDTISGIADAVDLLRSNARDLYGTVDGTRDMLAAQGMVYIEQALAGVRSGASVADYTGLSDAIGAARGGIESGRYTSEFERQRDTLVLAGQLSQLAESGELQLSFEERQLKAINEQLDYLNKLDKRAEELVNGTTALTGTVQSYFDQLLAFLNPEKPEPTATPSESGGGFSSGPSGGSAVYDKSADIGSYIDQFYSGVEDLRDVAITASIKGWTQADIAAATGYNVEDIEALFARQGIPAFDVGTNYVPRDMLAQIHEGEAIIPKAYNPAANPGMAGGNAELVAEVRALREAVAALQAAASATAGNTQLMPQMARQIDTYTNGGTFSRNKALV